MSQLVVIVKKYAGIARYYVVESLSFILVIIKEKKTFV
jgi:hypothetical protein